MMGKLLASMASRGAGQFRQAASGRHPSLDIAGTAHRLDPQLGRRPVMRSVLQLAFLEHDLDGTGERFHRNLQCAGQPRLVVYRGEGLPKHLGIVDQAISGVHRLLQIEARKRPVGAAREIGLAINAYLVAHIKRWSDHTVRTVAENLSAFLQWMEGAAMELDKVKLRHVEMFMNSLADQSSTGKLNVSTVVQRVGHACRFFDWAKRQGRATILWDGDIDAERGMARETRQYFRKASAIRGRNFAGKELGCLKLDGAVLPAHKIGRRPTSHRRHRS